MKILLATDGSAHSKAMINEFGGRIFAANTKLRIVSAYEKASFIMNTNPMAPSNEYYATADEYLLKSAQNAVENAAAALRNKNPGFIISTAAIEGSPKSIILEEAEKFGANLIVVGSHGYGALDRFLLGSVSQSVALHAKCSVEIVRKKNTKK